MFTFLCLRFSGNDLKKCNNLINEMGKAVKSNRFAKSRKMHLETEKICADLKVDEKSAIADKLNNLY